MSSPAASPDIAALKVLVVDDHVSFRGILLRMLKGMGFTDIEQAPNFQEALEKLKRKNAAGGSFYGIVFLDLHMPGGSGWDLLAKCREDKIFDNVAILIVSADSERASVVRAAQGGATDFVTKPFNETTLKAHVNKMLLWLERNAAKAAPSRLFYFIDPEDYPDFRRHCADRPELFPESYDAWYEEHMRAMAAAEANGETVFELVAFPADFKTYCKANGQMPRYAALEAYIVHKHKHVR